MLAKFYTLMFAVVAFWCHGLCTSIESEESNSPGVLQDDSSLIGLQGDTSKKLQENLQIELQEDSPEESQKDTQEDSPKDSQKELQEGSQIELQKDPQKELQEHSLKKLQVDLQNELQEDMHVELQKDPQNAVQEDSQIELQDDLLKRLYEELQEYSLKEFLEKLQHSHKQSQEYSLKELQEDSLAESQEDSNNLSRENLENLLKPGAMKPLEYHLLLEIKLADPLDFFWGTITIRAQCTVRTDHIILYVKDLVIINDHVNVLKELPEEEKKNSDSWRPILISGYINDEQKQRYIIFLDKPVKKDEIIVINIKYLKPAPPFGPDVAVARYSYSRKPEEEKLFLVTKSGPLNARRLFPCIHENDIKTKFRITIKHDTNVISLSNVLEWYRIPDFGENGEYIIKDKYHTSTLLSTFSVGFVVIEDFEEIKGINDLTRSEIRIWADEAVKDQMTYAHEIILQIFQFYEKYFNSAGHHVDIVALPNYGSVDEWGYGLITLEESLIANLNPSSIIRKMEIAQQLCHSYCHQYFGPQTTLSKWNENWLNMGFAMFYSTPCIRMIFPLEGPSFAEIQLVESFIRIMDIDAEINSHPVMPSEDIMNSTNFFKDSMLAETAHFYVRMMYFFLSREVLHQGVKSYIFNFGIEIANLDNVWNLFQLEMKDRKLLPNDTTVKTIMESWIFEKRHPQINITRDTTRKIVTIKQESSAEDGEEAKVPRIIPLNFVTRSEKAKNSNKGRTVRYWLQSEPIEVSVNNNDWIILDSRLDVLCRVLYDDKTLELLQKTLLNERKYEMIHKMSRTQLMSDMFAFAWMGKLSYLSVFKTIKYLSHEQSYLPMTVAFHELIKIRSALLVEPDILLQFQNYVQKILQPIFEREEFSNIAELTHDDYKKYHFKKLVVSTSCTFRVQSCLSQSAEIFDKWMNAKGPEKINLIPEALREIVYCYAIKGSINIDDNELNYLLQLYGEANRQNPNDILKGITCSSKAENLKLFLNWTLKIDKIAPEDRLPIFENVASNDIGYSLAMNFLKENIDEIIKINKEDPFTVYRYFDKLYGITWRENDLEELNLLAESKKDVLKNFTTQLLKSKNKAERNILWFRNTSKVEEFPAYLDAAKAEIQDELILKALKPLNYGLSFDISLKDDGATDVLLGRVNIMATCTTKTNHIILDMIDLIIVENEEEPVEVIKVLGNKEDEVESLDILDKDYDPESQRYIIYLAEELEINDTIEINMSYRKIRSLKEPDVALVRYSYSRDSKEGNKWVAVTKSRANNAKRLFPCIDKIDEKAQFRIFITHDENVISLSNTYSLGTETNVSSTEGYWITESYRETQFLSPFTIGFVLGNFELEEVVDKHTIISIRIWVDKAVKNQITYTRENIESIYHFYLNHFKCTHGVFRIDIVALPYYGSVDKWRYGLITLDESLIVDQNSPSETRNMEIALQLCNVYCHQYFGPQTTLSTWSENWLNMGFALFFGIPCLNHKFPDKGPSLANIKLVESFLHIMETDAEIKSHPVMLPDNLIDLRNFFDDYMLAETAHFYIRMMNFFLTNNVLDEGVRIYLRTYKSGDKSIVATLDEVWNLFPTKIKDQKLIPSDTTLKAIMDSWILQKGPAHIIMTRDSNANVVMIEQELATEDGEEPRIIPLNFITKSEAMKNFDTEKTVKNLNAKTEKKPNTMRTVKNSDTKRTVRYWLQSQPIKIPVASDNWIIHDSRLDVLCRVYYDPHTWKLLQETLLDKNNYEMIDVLSRTQLISDMFAFAWKRKLLYSFVFETILYLNHEKSSLPMIVAFHELIKIRTLLFQTDIFPLFQNYVKKILQPLFSRKEFSNISQAPQDDYENYYLKKLVVNFSCTFGFEKCIQQSKSLFNKWENNMEPKTMNPIPGPFRETVYCQAMIHGDEKQWNFLWYFYEKENPRSSDDVLNAIACLPNEEKLETFLEWSRDENEIAPEDSLTVFKSVASNKEGYSLARKFLHKNIKKILEENKDDPSYVYSYFEKLYEMTSNEQDFDVLEFIVASVEDKLQDIATRLAESRKKAQSNISWLKDKEKEFLDLTEEDTTPWYYKHFFYWLK